MKQVNKKEYDHKVKCLIALMKQINLGRIKHISVRNGQPECTLKTTIERETNFGGKCVPLIATNHNKLATHAKTVTLLRQLVDVEDGNIRNLEIRGGVPESMVLEQTVISVTNDLSIGPINSTYR